MNVDVDFWVIWSHAVFLENYSVTLKKVEEVYLRRKMEMSWNLKPEGKLKINISKKIFGSSSS